MNSPASPRSAHRCPTCRRAAAPSEHPVRDWPAFPFCTQRCQLVDLGKWFDEQYRISEPATPEDLDSNPTPSNPNNRDAPDQSD